MGSITHKNSPKRTFMHPSVEMDRKRKKRPATASFLSRTPPQQPHAINDCARTTWRCTTKFEYVVQHILENEERSLFLWYPSCNGYDRGRSHHTSQIDDTPVETAPGSGWDTFILAVFDLLLLPAFGRRGRDGRRPVGRTIAQKSGP